jgi:hypothetical protein
MMIGSRFLYPVESADLINGCAAQVVPMKSRKSGGELGKAEDENTVRSGDKAVSPIAFLFSFLPGSISTPYIHRGFLKPKVVNFFDNTSIQHHVFFPVGYETAQRLGLR